MSIPWLSAVCIVFEVFCDGEFDNFIGGLVDNCACCGAADLTGGAVEKGELAEIGLLMSLILNV